MRIPRNLASVFMAVVLVAGLCPGIAQAGELVGVEVSEAPEAPETVSVNASEGILQAGGLLQSSDDMQGEATTLAIQSLPDDSSLVAQAVPDTKGFQAALSKAAAAWDGKSQSVEVDVLPYGIKASQVEGLFKTFVNRNGQFFFFFPQFGCSGNGSGVVQKFMLQFNTAYTANDIEAFSAIVNNALSGVESGWNDEQKALYLHDWLVTHCTYDTTFSKRSAYDALVGGSAVCHGYSLAYDYLMSRAGVECDIVSSNGIGHAWNLVTVDGKTYYVDCTWDDPQNIPFEAHCSHEFFLCDKGSFGHTGDRGTVADWLDTSGANVFRSSTVASSKTYQSAYWRDVSTAIPHVGSLWAYVKSTVQANEAGATVYVHDYATGQNSELATVSPGSWPVWGRSYALWNTRYTCLASNGEAFLASTPTSLVRITTDGAQSVAYTLSSAEAAKGFVYGMLYDAANGTCRYQLGTEFTANPTGLGTYVFRASKISVLGIGNE